MLPPPRRRLAAAASVALAALLAAGGAGCASTEALRGLPPFFELGAQPAGYDTSDVVLRPFFRFKDQPGIDRTDLHYLFPLGHYKRRRGDVEHHLYPFFQWLRHTDPDGFIRRSLMVFPFVFAGDHPGHGTYFTLMPFGGTLRNLLGKEHIVHALFPLFAYTRFKEFETYHALFPIFALYRGAGNEGGRFLPFYGHHRKSRDGQVIYDRYTVLWPFLNWEYDNLNSRNPFSAFVFFPFYGEVRSKMVDETTLLWPFLRKRHEKANGITRWRVPFPLVMLAFGNETQRDFWPFFGYRKNGGFERWFALWPIFRSERHEKAGGVELRRWMLPFVWTFERREKETGKILYEQRKLWPIFRMDSADDGSFGFHLVSPLWFHDDDEETFQTILTPLFELMRYRHDGKGGKELRLLFSMFRTRWGFPGGEGGWSVLGGLVGHRTTREGDGLVRLFWFFEF